MGSLSGISGIAVALLLIILGILMVSGFLTALIGVVLWVLGIICIIAGIVVGAIAIFSKKDRY